MQSPCLRSLDGMLRCPNSAQNVQGPCTRCSMQALCRVSGICRHQGKTKLYGTGSVSSNLKARHAHGCEWPVSSISDILCPVRVRYAHGPSGCEGIGQAPVGHRDFVRNHLQRTSADQLNSCMARIPMLEDMQASWSALGALCRCPSANYMMQGPSELECRAQDSAPSHKSQEPVCSRDVRDTASMPLVLGKARLG